MDCGFSKVALAKGAAVTGTIKIFGLRRKLASKPTRKRTAVAITNFFSFWLSIVAKLAISAIDNGTHIWRTIVVTSFRLLEPFASGTKRVTVEFIFANGITAGDPTICSRDIW